MKVLSQDELRAFLESLRADYDVRAPIRLEDGTRVLGRLDEGPLAVAGGRIPRKPTDVFFPQFETMLSTEGGMFKAAKPPGKPLFVLGFTAEDCDCLEFIDRFYAVNYRDEVYFNKRDGAIVAAISGRCGAKGEMMKVSGGNCDMEFIYDGERYLVEAYSEAGTALVAAIPAAPAGSANEAALHAITLDALVDESNALPSDDLDTLNKASALLMDDAVPDGFWAEIAQRCIACTACNLACPTCTCFDLCDTDRGTSIERCRLWDSCQLDGFMREASTHNPMGTEALRTRRRIHHKLAADPVRWGHITCYLCGRCDDVCPTNIGIKAVTRELVSRYG